MCVILIAFLLILFWLQKVNTVSVDVGSLLEAKYRLTEAVKKLGHVDVLVNCAGITHTATLVDTPAEKFQVHCIV